MKFEKHYVGQTQNIEKRIDHHNSNQARWTKRYQPWNLVYFEEFSTRSEAMMREQEIKNISNIKKFLESMQLKEKVL